MKYNIPRVTQIDETSCASANYTMVGEVLGLSENLTDILKVTKSELGFAPFWRWLVKEKNAQIVDFSFNNLKDWADFGFDRFITQTDPKVVKFFTDRIKNVDDYQNDLKFLFESGYFTFNHINPTVNLLKEYFSKDYACDVMLDPWLIYGDKPEWYSLHRVTIVDVNGDEIIFHDPASDGSEFFKSNSSNFEKAFQIEGAELTCYRIQK
jgi:hypothetical protein